MTIIPLLQNTQKTTCYTITYTSYDTLISLLKVKILSLVIILLLTQLKALSHDKVDSQFRNYRKPALTHHMLKASYLILNFLDCDVYIKMTLLLSQVRGNELFFHWHFRTRLPTKTRPTTSATLKHHKDLLQEERIPFLLTRSFQ